MKDDERIREAVKTWTSHALDRVNVRQAVGIHSDELARLSGLQAHSELQVALCGFAALIDMLGERTLDYMPLLSIDLLVSEQVDVRVPALDEIEAQLSSEPPSIYIVDRRANLLLTRTELYRCPMVNGWPGLRDVYLFYECHRSEQARREEWEYSRKIYCEHYPEGLLP